MAALEMAQQVRMKCANGKGVSLLKYDNTHFPDPIDPVRGLNFVKEIQYLKGDIMLCTHPKTGTHWMGNTLWQLKSLDSEDRPQDKVLEMGPPLLEQKSPRIFWTHCMPNQLHLGNIADNKGKIVLMLRNPKDTMVSMYHQLKNGISFLNEQTWDEFFASYIEGVTICGSYFTFLQGWEEVLDDVSKGKLNLKIDLFYYEDYKREPNETIQRLNKFLELDRDEQYIDKVLEDTTFRSLRTRYNSDKKLKHELTEDASGNSIIFRKGEVGDWKTHLTVAQSETIDKLLEESLQHGIIQFKFEI